MKSRYVAFTQQPYCCVPACLQMVMYRRGIRLVEQEDLGYELGLTVPEEDAHRFVRVRTGAMPVSGWGTQVQKTEYSLDKAFSKLKIPLESLIYTIDQFETLEKLEQFFKDAQRANGDVLVCYREEVGGHVCVFDFLDGGDVWLVDPERSRPKHRKIKLAELYRAMQQHGAGSFAGCWEINLTK